MGGFYSWSVGFGSALPASYIAILVERKSRWESHLMIFAPFSKHVYSTAQSWHFLFGIVPKALDIESFSKY